MFELIQAGGWLMLPIIACSVIAMAITVERLFMLPAVFPSLQKEKGFCIQGRCSIGGSGIARFELLNYKMPHSCSVRGVSVHLCGLIPEKLGKVRPFDIAEAFIPTGSMFSQQALDD